MQVPYANGPSEDQLKALLACDLQRYEDALNGAIAVDLAQHPFDARLSFCFNIGIGGFPNSASVNDVNDSNFDSVSAEIPIWENAGSRYSDGLADRHENDIKLWPGQI